MPMSAAAFAKCAVVLATLACAEVAVHAIDNAKVCVSFRHDFACAIHGSDHRLLCWKHGLTAVRRAPAPQADGAYAFQSIDCRGDEVLGVQRNGGLAWSTNLWAPEPGTAPASSEADGGSAAADGATATAVSGEPEVYVRWDSVNPQTSPTTAFRGPVADWDANCVMRALPLTRRGELVCWPDPTFYSRRFTSRYVAFARAESTCEAEDSCNENTSPTAMCAVTTDGFIHCCCGDPASPVMTDVPEDGGFVDITLGIHHACARRGDGGLTCWGEDIAGRVAPPIVLPEPAQVVDASLTGQGDASNGVSEFAAAGGSKFSGEQPPIGAVEDPALQWQQVSAADYATCGVLGNGRPICWGVLTDTVLELPGPGCLVESVAINGFHGCGRLLPGGADLTAPNATDSPGGGIYCWQAFPFQFVGLEFSTQEWASEQRRVPGDVQPPLPVLANCMGLLDRENRFNATRVEGLTAAVLMILALFLTVLRLVILKRYGDFTWTETVMQHLKFWMVIVFAVLDVTSGCVFLFMDLDYISFRVMYIEAGNDHGLLLLFLVTHMILGVCGFFYVSFARAHDELFQPSNPRGPSRVALARRVMRISWAVFVLFDVPQIASFAVYMEVMARAELAPSVTAMASLFTSSALGFSTAVLHTVHSRSVYARALAKAQRRHPDVSGWKLQELMEDDERHAQKHVATKNARKGIGDTMEKQRVAAAFGAGASTARTNRDDPWSAAAKTKASTPGALTKSLRAIGGLGAKLAAAAKRKNAVQDGGSKGDGGGAGDGSDAEGDAGADAADVDVPALRLPGATAGGDAAATPGASRMRERLKGARRAHKRGSSASKYRSGGAEGEGESKALPMVRSAKELRLAAQQAKLLGSTKHGVSMRDAAVRNKSLRALSAGVRRPASAASSRAHHAVERPATANGAIGRGGAGGEDVDGRLRLPAIGGSRRDPARHHAAMELLGVSEEAPDEDAELAASLARATGAARTGQR